MAVRIAFVWAFPVILLSLVGEPALRLLTSGPLQFLLACLILIALVSSTRAALALSADLWSGRYDRERRAER